MTEEVHELDAELIVEINRLVCGATAEQHALLDEGGLRAAVERPHGGVVDGEFFPTIYDKAAALLHGLASRQVFENGNKRTAWLAANTFLELNGVDLGFVDPSHSNLFVRAVAVDHTLQIGEIAEWLITAQAAHMVDVRSTSTERDETEQLPKVELERYLGGLLVAAIRRGEMGQRDDVDPGELQQSWDDERLLVRELLSQPYVTAEVAVHAVVTLFGATLHGVLAAAKVDGIALVQQVLLDQQLKADD